MITPRKTVWLTQASKQQEKIWNLLLISQGIQVINQLENSQVKLILQNQAHLSGLPDLWMIDIMPFIKRKQSPYEFCRWCHQHYPSLKIILTHGNVNYISKPERIWAMKQGAQDLLAGFYKDKFLTDTIFNLQRILEVLDLLPIQTQGLNSVLQNIIHDPELNSSPINLEEEEPLTNSKQRKIENLDLQEVITRMRSTSGVLICDRRYRFRIYSNCFVGSEAVQWLMDTYNLSQDSAIQLGDLLMDKRIIHHVVDEQPFRNGYFFYRFYCDETKKINF